MRRQGTSRITRRPGRPKRQSIHSTDLLRHFRPRRHPMSELSLLSFRLRLQKTWRNHLPSVEADGPARPSSGQDFRSMSALSAECQNGWTMATTTNTTTAVSIGRRKLPTPVPSTKFLLLIITRTANHRPMTASWFTRATIRLTAGSDFRSDLTDHRAKGSSRVAIIIQVLRHPISRIYRHRMIQSDSLRLTGIRLRLSPVCVSLVIISPRRKLEPSFSWSVSLFPCIYLFSNWVDKVLDGPRIETLVKTEIHQMRL